MTPDDACVTPDDAAPTGTRETVGGAADALAALWIGAFLDEFEVLRPALARHLEASDFSFVPLDVVPVLIRGDEWARLCAGAGGDVVEWWDRAIAREPGLAGDPVVRALRDAVVRH